MSYSPLQLFLDSMRPSMESQLLAEFVHPLPGSTLLEIGCGNGNISYAVAARHIHIQSIVGIDTNFESLLDAKARYPEFCSHVENHPAIQFFHSDARSPCFRYACFDSILCNPPFFERNANRPAPDLKRRHARRDDILSLQQLFSCVQYLTKPNGIFSLIVPKQRTNEIRKYTTKLGFKVSQIQEYPEIRKRNGGVTLIELVNEYNPPTECKT